MPAGILTQVQRTYLLFSFLCDQLTLPRTGIGPEVFAFKSDDGDFTGSDAPNPDQEAFYEQNGFYILAEDYILRPEVLESNFYAWRATGDTKYLDRAAAAIDSFNKFLPSTVGFGGIWDVNNVNSDKIDDTESFWFAEVLKYLYVYSNTFIDAPTSHIGRYLTFDDPEHISLDRCRCLNQLSCTVYSPFRSCVQHRGSPFHRSAF